MSRNNVRFDEQKCGRSPFHLGLRPVHLRSRGNCRGFSALKTFFEARAATPLRMVAMLKGEIDATANHGEVIL